MTSIIEITETPMGIVVDDDNIEVTTVGTVVNAGGGGVTDHALLTHLDYASAGHTGFAGTGVSNTFTQTNNFQAVNATDLDASGQLRTANFYVGNNITDYISAGSGGMTFVTGTTLQVGDQTTISDGLITLSNGTLNTQYIKADYLSDTSGDPIALFVGGSPQFARGMIVTAGQDEVSLKIVQPTGSSQIMKVLNPGQTQTLFSIENDGSITTAQQVIGDTITANTKLVGTLQTTLIKHTDQVSALVLTGSGNVSVGGTITGNGSGLTSLNASNLGSGTVPVARLSGITTTQLSATAGITNGQLANSSLTVTAGTGMSGGGSVSLGGSVTLNVANGVYTNAANTFTTGAQTIQTGADATKGLVIKQNSGTQSGNLTEWSNSSGTALSSVGPSGALSIGGTITGTVQSSTALTVGRQGATNPALQVDSNTASSVTGVGITANVAGSGVTLAAISSGTNEAITISSKGSGNVTLSGSGALSLSCSGLTTVANNAFQVRGCFAVGSNSNVVIAASVPLNFTASAASSGTATNQDVGFSRKAAKVLAITDGSTAGGTFSSPALSPTSISANQNDYAPGVARLYRLTTDGSGSKDITGLSASNQDGQECWITNVGTDNLVLKHQSASSTAANRFLCTTGADITLASNEIASLWYDNTTTRWRVRK